MSPDRFGNDAHSIALLSVPTGSRVLDVGAGQGRVARSLAERSCRITAIEANPQLAELASDWYEKTIVGDVELPATVAELSRSSFDVILTLDVLEHLKDPGRALSRLLPLLDEGGIVIASIPNVAHAAVRLQLLHGRFKTTEIGLLDKTHLHFFDRPGAEALLEQSGLVITDRFRVRVGLTGTEIQIDPSEFPPDLISSVMSDPDSETYQFVFVASPKKAVSGVEPSAASALQQRLEDTEDALSDARTQLSKLQSERCDTDALRSELEAVKSRVGYRLVLRAERAVGKVPLLKKVILAITGRAGSR